MLLFQLVLALATSIHRAHASCPQLSCTAECEIYALDESGCPTCTCDQAYTLNSTNATSSPASTTDYPCPVFRCAYACAKFKVDDNGCSTCECDWCDDYGCSLYCEDGFVLYEDEQGNYCPACKCAVLDYTEDDTTTLDAPGSDRDEYGCYASGGYTYCKAIGVCVRVWELEEGSPCLDELDISNTATEWDGNSTGTGGYGGGMDAYGCYSDAGYSYCHTTGECVREWELEQDSDCYLEMQVQPYSEVEDSSSPKYGAGTDEHGCMTSAGYSYCYATDECVRLWELEKSSPCFTEQIIAVTMADASTKYGSGRDEYGCVTSAGYTYCLAIGECVRLWELEEGSACIAEYYDVYETTATDKDKYGGSVDEYGCYASAGYSYCKATGECVRVWELEEGSACLEELSSSEDESVNASSMRAATTYGGSVDEYGCYVSAGYTYCKATGECVRVWELEEGSACLEELSSSSFDGKQSNSTCPQLSCEYECFAPKKDSSGCPTCECDWCKGYGCSMWCENGFKLYEIKEGSGLYCPECTCAEAPDSSSDTSASSQSISSKAQLSIESKNEGCVRIRKHFTPKPQAEGPGIEIV